MKRIDPLISVSFSYSRHTADDVGALIAAAKRLSWLRRLVWLSPIQLITSHDTISMQPTPPAAKPSLARRAGEMPAKKKR